MSNLNSVSGFLKTGSQTLKDIASIKINGARITVAAGILAALTACGGGGGGKKNPPVVTSDPVVTLKVEVNDVVKNATSITVYLPDGTTRTFAANDFNESDFRALPEGTIGYKVTSDGMEFFGLNTTKAELKNVIANAFTDYMKTLSPEGQEEFLKLLGDLNLDGQINTKDVTGDLPTNMVLPDGIQAIYNAKNNGQDTLEAEKKFFEASSLVKITPDVDNETGVVTLTLFPSSSDNVIEYEIIDGEEESSAKVSFRSSQKPTIAQKSGVQGDAVTVTLSPGQTLKYGERSQRLGILSKLKEYVNSILRPPLDQTDFSGEEDKDFTATLTAKADVSNFQLVSQPSKGTVEIGIDGTFTYTPNKNTNGEDRFNVSYQFKGKIYKATITLDVKAVDDLPEATDFVLGTLPVGSSKTVNVEDIAKSVDFADNSGLIFVGVKSLSPNVTVTFNSSTGTLTAVGVGSTNVQFSVKDANGLTAEIVKSVEVIGADKNALEKLLNEVNTLSEEDYTPISWEAMQTVFDEAFAVFGNPSATDTQIAGAVMSLQKAIDDLVEVADFALLVQAITDADTKVESTYTSVSWTAFKTVLDQAKILVADRNATQEDVDAKALELTLAMQNLIEKPPVVNKTALNALITTVNGLNSSSYTTTSWTALQTALTAANTVVANANAIQSEVNTALTNLQNAQTALVLLGDKTSLNALITTVNGLDVNNFTSNSWAALQSALGAANTVVSNGQASVSEVNTALTNLQGAYNARVNISGLKNLITTVSGGDSANYTASSWAAFQSQLINAISVRDTGSSTTSQVNSATTLLQNAYDALVSIATLKTTITTAQGLTESSYTPSTWATLQSALTAAISVRDNGTSTTSQVNIANTNLQNAITALVLDVVAPIATPAYSTTAPTNGSVTVTLNMNENIPGTISGWDKVNGTTFTKVYSVNGSETVNFSDAAGNPGSVNVSVANIDTFVSSTASWVGGSPSQQGVQYTDLELSIGETIGSITSLTASHGTVGDFSIVSGNVRFDFLTPHQGSTTLTLSGADLAGNPFSINTIVSSLEAVPYFSTSIPNPFITIGEYDGTTPINFASICNNCDTGAQFSLSGPAAAHLTIDPDTGIAYITNGVQKTSGTDDYSVTVHYGTISTSVTIRYTDEG